MDRNEVLVLRRLYNRYGSNSWSPPCDATMMTLVRHARQAGLIEDRSDGQIRFSATATRHWKEADALEENIVQSMSDGGSSDPAVMKAVWDLSNDVSVE